MIKKSKFNLKTVQVLVSVLALILIFFAMRSEFRDEPVKVNVLVEPTLEFDSMGKFSEGLAIVSIGEFGEAVHGYIDTSGMLVIPCEYSVAYEFNEGLAAVCKNGGYGFIDKTGNEVIPFEYEYALCFVNGLAAVRKDGMYWYINSSGETVIAFEYNRAGHFFRKTAIAAKDGKYGIIDINGDIVIPFEYNNIYTESHYGMYRLVKDEKNGLIDVYGNVIVPCIYELINTRSLDDGYIVVKQNGKWGILIVENFTHEPEEMPVIGGFLGDWNW